MPDVPQISLSPPSCLSSPSYRIRHSHRRMKLSTVFFSSQVHTEQVRVILFSNFRTGWWMQLAPRDEDEKVPAHSFWRESGATIWIGSMRTLPVESTPFAGPFHGSHGKHLSGRALLRTAFSQIHLTIAGTLISLPLETLSEASCKWFLHRTRQRFPLTFCLFTKTIQKRWKTWISKRRTVQKITFLKKYENETSFRRAIVFLVWRTLPSGIDCDNLEWEGKN